MHVIFGKVLRAPVVLSAIWCLQGRLKALGLGPESSVSSGLRHDGWCTPALQTSGGVPEPPQSGSEQSRLRSLTPQGDGRDRIHQRAAWLNHRAAASTPEESWIDLKRHFGKSVSAMIGA